MLPPLTEVIQKLMSEARKKCGHIGPGGIVCEDKAGHAGPHFASRDCIPGTRSILDGVRRECYYCRKTLQEHADVNVPFPCINQAHPLMFIYPHQKDYPYQGEGVATVVGFAPSSKLTIVSKCPHCGNPIWSKDSCNEGETPTVVRSCHCWQREGLPVNVDEKKLGTTKEG